jgi:hypothetical protein
LLRRNLRVVLAVIALVALGLLVPLRQRDEPPAAADVFPESLGPGLSYVPMPDGDRVSFETTFLEATAAVDAAVRTVAVEGSSSVGLRVISMVFANPVKNGERTRVFTGLENQIPFLDPVRETLDGREAWVHAEDRGFASAVAVIDGRRVVLVYGGLVAAERTVVTGLDL